MTHDEMMQRVMQELPTKRWVHTQGVMETAVKLAKRFGADPVKAELASLLHDFAKFWPVDKMERIIREQGLPQLLLHYDRELWHAPVGAFVAERDFDVHDPEVLDAIRYHTSGREYMSLMDKVVCLADYMEPGRDFPEVVRIRELAEHSMEKALIAGFDSTMQFLISRGKRIYPLTLLARNHLIEEVRNGNNDL